MNFSSFRKVLFYFRSLKALHVLFVFFFFLGEYETVPLLATIKSLLWDWLNFTECNFTFYPYLMEFDTSYDFSSPFKRIVRCYIGLAWNVWILSIFTPPWVFCFRPFKIRNQWSSLKEIWLSKCFQAIFHKLYWVSVKRQE